MLQEAVDSLIDGSQANRVVVVLLVDLSALYRNVAR